MWFFLFLLLLFAVLVLLMRTSSFQTYVAGKVATYLSEELETTISIGKVHLTSLQDAHFEDLYVEDLHGDTLLFAQRLTVEGVVWRSSKRLLLIDDLQLLSSRHNLTRYADRDSTDLSILLQRMSGGPPKKQSLTLAVNHIVLREHRFTYNDQHVEKLPKGIDFKHLDVSQQLLLGNDLRIQGDSVKAVIDSLVLSETTGLVLSHLAADVFVSPARIEMDDMSLRTAGSALNGDVRFTQEDYSDFKKFIENVHIRADLIESRLAFRDIGLFTPDLDLDEFAMDINGRFRGPVSDLKGRGVELRVGQRTRFEGDVDLVGLPDLGSTFMIIDVDRFQTDRNDLARLMIPSIQKDPLRIVPPFLERFGRMEFSGNFTGFTNAFTAYGKFRSALGDIDSDISMRRDSTTKHAVVDGKLATTEFELGKALGDDRFGKVTASLDLKGDGAGFEDFKAEMIGEVPYLFFAGNALENITVEGLLEERIFNGFLRCQDDDLDFEFNGLADFSGRWPQVDFSAFVQHVNPHAFGVEAAPEGGSLSFRIRAEGLLAPDSLNGTISARDILICVQDEEYYFKDASLKSSKKNGIPRLEFESSFLDMTLDGNSIPSQIPLVVKEVLYSVFPSIDNEHDPKLRNQDMTVLLTFKDTEDLLGLLFPNLFIAPGTEFQMDLESKTLHLDAQLRSTRIGYNGMFLSDVDAMIDKSLDIIAFSAKADRSALNDSIYISSVELQGKAYQDDLEVNAFWEGSSHNSSGDLSFEASVEGPMQGTIRILPSELFFGRGTWEILDTSIVHIDSIRMDIAGFELWNEDQLVKLNGQIGRSDLDTMRFELQNVDLEQLNVFMEGSEFDGDVTGTGEIINIFGETIVLSDARIDSLRVGADLLGDIEFTGDWNERRRRIEMVGSVSRGVLKAVEFSGWVRPEDENAMALKVDADRFDLSFLNSYIPNGLTDIEGTLTGIIRIDGSLTEPLMSGKVQLDSASIRVDYLNTTYEFSSPVTILPDMFSTDFMTVKDVKGNTGKATVTLIHDIFKDFNYDILVEMQGMQCLNTDASVGGKFYGQAFGTGDIMISGFQNEMEIGVNARTEKETHIVFPLGDGREVSSYDFIEFVRNDSIKVSKTGGDVLGVTIAMSIDVTSDAFVELVFDPTVGDILSGSGEGILDLNLTPNGDLFIFGEIEVVEGAYLFTLRNLINKKFSIEPGGRVSWYGDPYNAQLDLNAVYSLRAPLYDILYDATDAYKRRVPVEVAMELSKSMLNPEIGFDVRLPSVDEGVRTQVNSVLSTDQELNRQVFSLMVLGKFAAPASSATGGSFASDQFAGTTGSELLSNQVSNWLSGLSDNLDLGVNYRTGDKTAQDELAVAVSTQLFDERLRLSTNVGVQYGERPGVENSSVIGDFELEYLLTDDGKLRVKAFSRSNDQNLNQIDQAASTQGAGIGFREDFDNWQTFWRNLTAAFRGKD